MSDLDRAITYLKATANFPLANLDGYIVSGAGFLYATGPSISTELTEEARIKRVRAILSAMARAHRRASFGDLIKLPRPIVGAYPSGLIHKTDYDPKGREIGIQQYLRSAAEDDLGVVRWYWAKAPVTEYPMFGGIDGEGSLVAVVAGVWLPRGVK